MGGKTRWGGAGAAGIWMLGLGKIRVLPPLFWFEPASGGAPVPRPLAGEIGAGARETPGKFGNGRAGGKTRLGRAFPLLLLGPRLPARAGVWLLLVRVDAPEFAGALRAPVAGALAVPGPGRRLKNGGRVGNRKATRAVARRGAVLIGQRQSRARHRGGRRVAIGHAGARQLGGSGRHDPAKPRVRAPNSKSPD